MNSKQFFLLALALAGLAALIYVLIPSSMGIKSQLQWLVHGAVWLIVWIIGIAAWFLEVVVLLAGPWFLGWFGRWCIKKVDERFNPESDMAPWQGIFLNVGLVAVVFLLWILAPLVATWVPPISTYIVGPWIRSYMETGLVWWGVYGALSYMLYAPARAFFEGY